MGSRWRMGLGLALLLAASLGPTLRWARPAISNHSSPVTMVDSLRVRPPFEEAWSLTTDGENLLTNPGFEEGFSIREDPAVNVANGWEPWYLTGEEFGIRPEWNEELLWLPSIRVLHADFAQKMFNTWGVHTAGIYQQVAVTEGSLLEFSIWVQVWSSDCDDICVSPLEPCHPPSPNRYADDHAYPDRHGHAGPPGQVHLPAPHHEGADRAHSHGYLHPHSCCHSNGNGHPHPYPCCHSDGNGHFHSYSCRHSDGNSDPHAHADGCTMKPNLPLVKPPRS